MRRARQLLLEYQGLAEGGILGALVAFCLVTTVPNIANNPVVGGDEAWIISASAKLAEEGVFGSDLFSGFFNAEDRYYFNLPLHHLILAGVFKIFGAGLTEARLVSLAFGLAALALTYVIGRRVGGPWIGVGAAALLVLLRLNLAPFSGLTLTDLGATVRYDLVTLPFALCPVVLLIGRPLPISGRRAAAAGFVLGLGCLVQFLGAFFIVPLALFLGSAAAPGRQRLFPVAAFGLALLLPFLPYFAFIADGWEDFRAQGRALQEEEGRTDFFDPGFYIDNLAREPDRYNLALDLDSTASLGELTERPSARLVFFLAGPAALIYVAMRAVRGSIAHRLLALILVSLLVEFALFESTKRFVYWVVVAPFLCVALADAGTALVRWRPAEPRVRTWGLAAVGILALVIALEGVAVGAKQVRDAGSAADYSAVGDEVRRFVPAGSPVVADNRMWLGLRDMEVRSFLLLFYWTNPSIAGDRLTDLAGAMERIDADYLLISPLTRDILANLTPADQAVFQGYLDEHGRLVGTAAEPPYGPLEVYELRR